MRHATFPSFSGVSIIAGGNDFLIVFHGSRSCHGISSWFVTRGSDCQVILD